MKALTCFENTNKPSANDYIAKNDNKLNENLKLSTEKTIKFQPRAIQYLLEGLSLENVLPLWEKSQTNM